MESQPTPYVLSHGASELKLNLAQGAEVTDLSFNQNGRRIELIKSDGEVVHSNPWLFPFPNRLANGDYRFEGKSYHFEHNDYGRPNALHGFIREREFTVSAEGSNDVSAWVEVTHSDAGDFAPYPFASTVSIRYELTKEALSIAFKVTNSGSDNMPVGIGWHPYFYLPSGLKEASMKLTSCQEIEVDDVMIPTGKKKPSTCFDSYRELNGITLDTCFELNEKEQRSATLLKSGDDYEIEIWQDGAHGFVQVYTPDDGQFIAIEPMTCGIDAFNTGEGLRILAPGETWELSCGVNLL